MAAPDADNGADNAPWPPDVGSRLADYIRELRFHADLSQRELAAAAGVTPAKVARLESDIGIHPRLSTLTRVVAAMGHRLLICDAANTPTQPQHHAFDGCRDNAQRHLPAHLDAVPRGLGALPPWWLEHLGPWTFARDRDFRDSRREARRLPPPRPIPYGWPRFPGPPVDP
jgi:transcriptional regulator with XRE-family HTH domain